MCEFELHWDPFQRENILWIPMGSLRDFYSNVTYNYKTLHLTLYTQPLHTELEKQVDKLKINHKTNTIRNVVSTTVAIVCSS